MILSDECYLCIAKLKLFIIFKKKRIMEKLSISSLIAACSALRCRYDFFVHESEEASTTEYADLMLTLAKDYEGYVNEFEEYCKKLSSVSYEK